MTAGEARAGLERAGARREAAEQEREAAMREIARLALEADRAGVPRREIARLAGVSRTTVYAILDAP